MIHTTKDGLKIICEFNKPSNDKFFKVNLPRCKSDFESGNGEGVWGYTDDLSYEKIMAGCNGNFVVKILNDSVYYSSLVYESTVIVESRNDKRPVAVLDELKFTYGEPISEEEKTKILHEIWKRHRDNMLGL